MPKSVIVTFDDGSTHRYDNVPDTVTPDEVESRAAASFAGKKVTKLTGEKAPAAESVEPQAAEPAAVDGDLQAMANAAAVENQIDPILFNRLIDRESKFNPQAVSPAGAQGLGQLMPGTAADLGVTDPFDAQQNLKGSARYFRQLMDRYQGDTRKALAAYNWGMGNVDKYGLEGMPKETRDYVAALSGPAGKEPPPLVVKQGLKDLGAEPVVNQGELISPLEAGRSVVQGGIEALTDFPQTMTRGASQIAQFLGGMVPEAVQAEMPNIPSLSDILEKGYAQVRGIPEVQPQTEVGKQGSSELAFTLGMMAGPGGIPGRNVVRPTYVEPPPKMGSTVAQRLAKLATENIHPLELRKAGREMEQSALEGVDMTLGQALGRPTRLDKLESYLARETSGQPLVEVLNRQPGQVAEVSDRFKRAIPGKKMDVFESAPLQKEVAEEAVGASRQARTNVVEPLFKAAGDIDQGSAKNLAAFFLRASKDEKFRNTPTQKILEKIALSLQVEKAVPGGRTGILKADGTPLLGKGTPAKYQTNVDTIHGILKMTPEQLAAGTGIEGPGIAYKYTKQVDDVVKAAQERLKAVSPKYGEALKEHKRLSDIDVNPTVKGPTGFAAGANIADDGPDALRTGYYTVFEKGSPSTIERTYREAIRREPGQKGVRTVEEAKKAWKDIGASWIGQKIDDALRIRKGAADPSTSSNLVKALVDTPADRLRLKAVTKTLAEAHGIKPERMEKMVDTYVSIIDKTSKRPGSTQALSDQQLENALLVFPKSIGWSLKFSALRQAAKMANKFMGESAEAELSRLLADPKGVKALEMMADEAARKNHRNAMAILAAARVGFAAQAQEE